MVSVVKSFSNNRNANCECAFCSGKIAPHYNETGLMHLALHWNNRSRWNCKGFQIKLYESRLARKIFWQIIFIWTFKENSTFVYPFYSGKLNPPCCFFLLSVVLRSLHTRTAKPALSCCNLLFEWHTQGPAPSSWSCLSGCHFRMELVSFR